MALNTSNITKEEIIRVYKTPGHPVAFSSPGAIYTYYKGKVPLALIRDALEETEAYTLHREYKQPAVHNPFYCYQRRQKFQADLIDVVSLAEDNNGVKYLLVIIDEFSRKVWVGPLTSKTGAATRESLKQWIDLLSSEEDGWREKEKRFLSDAGKEFVNSMVNTLLVQHNFKQDTTKNIIHCGIAERVNKSLQQLIYKMLTDQGETEYVSKLPLVVQTYNNRAHRTLKNMSPNDADSKANEDRVRGIHTERYGKINERRKRTTRFVVGDKVRVKTYARGPSSARRSYLQQFHGEYFTIVEVKTRMPIPMYILKSMNTEDTIEGGFYANELSRVQGDLFKIDKILKTEGQGENKRYLVRWKYFDPRWDSYVKASDLVENQN